MGTAMLLLWPYASAQRGFQDRDVVPQGSRVEYKSFPSRALGHDVPYGLYLPPSYAASKNSYPVLYFLHGANENQMRWSTRGSTDIELDRMVAEKRVGGFIVAIPFGGNSFYTNAKTTGERWEDMIVSEFIPMIEKTYRVRPERKARGISGISMGGYGSLKIALKHPEMFGSVSAHSAMLIKDVSVAANATAGRRMQFFLPLFERIFGLSQGTSFWDENNPFALAKDTRRLNGLKVYLDCGTEDEFGFYVGAKEFSDLLRSSNYPHEFHLYPGNHGWDYAKQHTPASLEFHWKAFSGQ